MKSAIFTYYQSNIAEEVVAAQREVVNRFRPSDVDYVMLQSEAGHAEAIDWFLADSRYDHYVLLDIDAIPLTSMIIPYLLSRAAAGTVIGNIQRSNHIDNGRHVFAAPSFMALSKNIWWGLGRPSFCATARGDVAEEVSFRAEAMGVPLEMLRPLRSLGEPMWALDGDDQPRYGIGTFFGLDGFEISYHNYQIRDPQSQQLFLDVCKAVLERHGRPPAETRHRL